jgi:hypothetical protein
MKRRLMVCTFLVGCFTALALGQQNVEHLLEDAPQRAEGKPSDIILTQWIKFPNWGNFANFPNWNDWGNNWQNFINH